MFFTSHCGVTDAIFQSSHFSSPFPVSSWGQHGLFLEPFPSNSPIPLPRLAAFDQGQNQSLRHLVKCSHACFIDFGRERRTPHPTAPTSTSHAVLFFSAQFARRNFFVVSFHAPWYKPRGPASTYGARTEWHERQQPASRYCVFLGCTICGEYRRQYGTISVGRPDDGGSTHPSSRYFLVQPDDAKCLRCGHKDSDGSCATVGTQLGEQLHWFINLFHKLINRCNHSQIPLTGIPSGPLSVPGPPHILTWDWMGPH